MTIPVRKWYIRGDGITDQIPERCLYTNPADTTNVSKSPAKNSHSLSHISGGPVIHDRTHF